LDDCNDPTSSPYGYTTAETAIDKNGERVSAMSAYLSKAVALERVDRLTVCTGTVGSRLEISGDEIAGRTVTGVNIQSSTASSPTKEYFVKARREVILASGAMNSPQILLLSGIGPSQNSSSDPSLAIPQVKELPAVGADFSDHYAVPIMLELPKRETLHILESGLWGLWYVLVWIFTGKGFMSLSSAPTAIFLHTDHIDEQTMEVTTPPYTRDPFDSHIIPNVEVMTIPVNSLERAVPGRNLFSIFPTIIQPQAKGEIAYLLLKQIVKE
jgi:choline dehydrogenase-like flavoprotein